MDPGKISYNHHYKYLMQSLQKMEPTNSLATTFIQLLKFVDTDKQIQDFDFAGNFSSMFQFINSVSDSLLHKQLIQLYQTALSQLTDTCRKYYDRIKELEAVPKLEEFKSTLFETTNKIVSKSDNAQLSFNTSTRLMQDKQQTKNYIIKRLKPNFETKETQRLLLSKIYLYSKINYYPIMPFEGFTFYYKDGIKDLSPAIVIKYQKERSLSDVLFKSRVQTVFKDTQKMILLLGISSGMNYLHQNQLIHGNLKPSSVLLNTQYEPFLTDFYYETLNSKDLYDVRYIPPEQLSKQTHLHSSTHNLQYDTAALKADVYSFGMVAFSILSSQLPFGQDAQQPQQIIQLVLKGQRPTFPFYVPDNFVSIISKCWDSDPMKRPTFSEIIGSLLENECSLPETDMDVYSRYVRKVLPDYRAPTICRASPKSTSGHLTLRSYQSSKIRSLESFETTEFDEKVIDFDDPESVFDLALRLFNTNDRDPEKIAVSIKYIKISANKGIPEAQVEYGKILLEGNQESAKPLAKNEVEAAFYFRLAADKGNIDGQYWYGRCLYYGIGVEQNYNNAAKYLRESANKGNRDAQYMFGLCLREGDGVPQNVSAAIQYFQMAKKIGEVASIRHLSELST